MDPVKSGGKKTELDLRCLPYTTASTLPNSKKFMRLTSNDANDSYTSTMDRKQMHRLSWMNMRRKDEMIEINKDDQETPSPKTTRSYVSNISTVENTVFCNNGYTISGRTTATSGRISSSGVTTISSSNNTLNDLHADYHLPPVNINSTANRHHLSSIQSIQGSPAKANVNGSFNLANGSTIKLIADRDDEKNQQTKCSVFRGLILCICLNVTYANVVRFPRELDNYGSVFLIPYVILLFLVGLPLVLLEISVGQFLGQGAAHTWRASPIFKGACIISRFASWLSTIWISIQAVVALAYVGMYSLNAMPFRECLGKIAHSNHSFRYHVATYHGQECIDSTFLKPFWENPLYFGMLSIGLICIWIVLMLCTHSGKILRRSLFLFGLLGFALLCSLTGWEVHNSLQTQYFPAYWNFDTFLLMESNIWFNALMQVLFSLNCGFGVLPTLTGKFLYKGDAVRTSVVYLCFNLLINAIAVTLFMVQFDRSLDADNLIVELKPFTSIYDRFLNAKPYHALFGEVMPPMLNLLVVICCIVSITVAIYTATRLVPRRPNYVICLIALVGSIMSFSAPRFVIARILDSQIIGTLIITALIFEIIAVTWIYGIKNIYTDLEFSIGRPILRAWMWLWCIIPAILTGLLVWWCADDDSYDVLPDFVPRWAPILFVLGIILIIAGVQVFHQVDYNFFGMICEASKPAKEWGPADPLARHAWKQWRSVCQDTGRRDFTLRRRGTRDYTHSIKKGQYTGSSRYAGNLSHINNSNPNNISTNSVMNSSTNMINHQPTTPHTNWKSSTPGNSSPNYSGSMFGDSAIEEDISVDKFPGITQQFVPYHQQTHHQTQLTPEMKIALRYSNRKQTQVNRLSNSQLHSQTGTPQQHPNSNNLPSVTSVDKHREIVYIRRLSDDGGKHATRIEITPSNESITYANISAMRNPLAHSSGSHGNKANYVKRSSSVNVLESNRSTDIIKRRPPPPPKITTADSADHICWRKYNANPEEYSTEL